MTTIPPKSKPSPRAWIKKNLFSSWYNGILTLASLLSIGWLGENLIRWGLTEARWEAIADNLRLFFVGRYPAELLWRAWMALGIIVILSGISWGILTASSRWLSRSSSIGLGILAAASVAVGLAFGEWYRLPGMVLLLAIAVVAGKRVGQKYQNSSSWLGLVWFVSFFLLLILLQGNLFLGGIDDLSGLLLTLTIALSSIVLSFPFGVLLALGRQSEMPIIRWLSIAYIEVIRGLPLIGILFMAQVMLPLVLPLGVRLDRAVRAIAGFTIFSSAYLAENVRAGLQSVPRGQTDAAKALGLNPISVLVSIVLPQALKAVIPTIVGQFISLFKDTSLLAIVGLVDLLGMAQAILANPQYIGRYSEVYIFVAAIYWICCYSMSLASKKLEKRLGTTRK